jgi:hypothetical protein
LITDIGGLEQIVDLVVRLVALFQQSRAMPQQVAQASNLGRRHETRIDAAVLEELGAWSAPSTALSTSSSASNLASVLQPPDPVGQVDDLPSSETNNIQATAATPGPPDPTSNSAEATETAVHPAADAADMQ